MADEILCSEAWARFDPDEVARAGEGSYAVPMLRAKATEMARLCRALPAGVVPAGDGEPSRTTLPVLWLTGDGEPQDPPANLEAVASQQPNSRVVVMPAQSATLMPLAAHRQDGERIGHGWCAVRDRTALHGVYLVQRSRPASTRPERTAQ